MIGAEDGLRYSIRWPSVRPKGTAAEATEGDLYVEVAGKPVWGQMVRGEAQGLSWTWVELLEHLARQWAALMWEEVDPLGLGEISLRLRERAEARWSRLADHGMRDREQRALLRFERSHDLAFAAGGAAFPLLWLVRQGGEMRISAARAVTRRPLPEVTATLGALGEEIATRLQAVQDERSVIARRDWHDRDQAPVQTVVALATGIAPADLAVIEGGREPSAVWGFIGGRPLQPTAELAAARMIGRAPSAVVARALDWIRDLPVSDTPDLDALSSRARVSRRTNSGGRSAFSDGYALATWLRSIPGIVRDGGSVDPASLLARFGVQVDETNLEWPAVDAIACWGAHHGPAVLVNSKGTHAGGPGGRNSTLAHELCHLLVDRWSALPVAEVFGGRAPLEAEQRANAFAAELLLPRAAAGSALRGAHVTALVDALKRKYGVSGQVVAWQAIRSDVSLSEATIAYLRGLVPAKDIARFDAAVAGR